MTDIFASQIGSMIGILWVGSWLAAIAYVGRTTRMDARK